MTEGNESPLNSLVGQPQMPDSTVPSPPVGGSAPGAPRPSVPPKKKGKGKIVAVVIAILFVLGAIGSCSDKGEDATTSKPDAVSQQETSGEVPGEEGTTEETQPDPEVVKADKGTLTEYLSTYSVSDPSAFTDETAAKYQNALTQAEAVAANEAATQEEVDAAAEALKTSYDGLQIKFNEANYEELSYKSVARDPDSYVGKKLMCTGNVLQVLEGDGETDVRLATDGEYDDVVFVGFDPNILDVRVLEDDSITVYGTCLGLYSYTATLGQEISLPAIYADKVIINE